MSEQDSVVQEPALPTPGQLLKEAREAKGLSLEQVANKINLRAHNIEAIENDEDDSKLSTTFTKGYLKLYAKFVDVNESEVLQAYERINSVAKEPAKLQSFSRRVAKQTSDARLMMLTYFIIAIVIALSVLWWFQQSKETTITQTSTAPLPVVEQQSANNAASEEVIPEAIRPSSTQNNQDVVQGIVENALTDDAPTTLEDVADAVVDTQLQSDDSPDNLIDGQTDAVEQTEQVDSTEEQFAEVAGNSEDSLEENTEGRVELIFEFSDDCWMNLVDATGEPVAFGVKVAGYVMTVDGIPPFEVTLGAPQAVQISMAGEAVDMSRFPAGRTARFVLPLQE